MYKLLIVDDELSIRQGIAKSNPWSEWGFEVAGLCANGAEALAFLSCHSADVVLSDIRMPKMDGVELMYALKRLYPQVRVIILSGYNDFEYLDTAIENNAMKYLLKPTDIEEFERVFKKVKQELDQERAQAEEYHTLKTAYNKSLEYKYTVMVNTLLYGHMNDVDATRSCADLESAYGVNPENCILIFVTPDKRSLYEEAELFRLKSKVTDVCNSLRLSIKSRFFLTQDETVVGFLAVPGNKIQPLPENTPHTIQSAIRKTCGATVSIGVSEPCTAAGMLPALYEQARQCAYQNVFLGTETIFTYDQFKETKVYPVTPPDSSVLHAFISTGDQFDRVEAELSRFFSSFANQPLKEYEYIDRVCLDKLFHLSVWAARRNICFDNVLSSLGVSCEDIHLCDSLPVKRMFLTAIFYAVSLEWNKIKGLQPEKGHIAVKVRDLLDREYASNAVSLEYVAGILGKNPVYISKIFREAFGLNFSEYLLNKRMSLGRELLKNPILKVYEIAEQLGYADVSNFIKVFRKHFGLTPNQYRASLGDNFGV